MPFESKAQQRFMFAKHPEMAKEWADKTPDISALPEHVKKMADGGSSNDPESADFEKGENYPNAKMTGMPPEVLSTLMGGLMGGMNPVSAAEEIGPALKGLGETGEVTIGRAAPEMEEAASPKVEAFIKGVQKSPNGNEVKIWGVRGDPDEISKLGYGSDPASVPEHILRAKGVLPESVDVPAQDAPNGYAKGGFPHVTFMEDQTPEGVKETTHLAKSHEEPKMAKGGVMPKEDMTHEDKMSAIYKAMGIKKYADGGAVDASQPPSGPAIPNQSDPSYWDQIKAALGQVTAPISAAIAPAQAINSTVAPAIAPAVAGALNNLTGSSLPVPPPPTAAPVMPPTAPTMPPAMPPAAPSSVLGSPTAASASTAGMPNLSTIFNQDTSKLTQGVNPEDRQALVTKLQGQQEGLGGIIAQAVSGLGDALAAKGGKEQHSLQNIFAMDKTQRDEALANFDQARQDRLQKLQLQTQMGDNALKQAAAADAYGTDEHLNSMLGAPKGTMKKDLPTYMGIMSSQIAAKEKDADLYMKAHAQAGTDVDNAIKNSSIFGIKPSPAQLQASGAKLADQYYNRAKGNVLVKPSDGGAAQWVPAQNLNKARQMDPNLTVQP